MSRVQSSRGNRTSNLIGRGKVPPIIPGSVVAQRLAHKPIRQEGRGENFFRSVRSAGPCRPARITNLCEHVAKQKADKVQRWREAKLPTVEEYTCFEEFNDPAGQSLSGVEEMQAQLVEDQVWGDDGLSIAKTG